MKTCQLIFFLALTIDVQSQINYHDVTSVHTQFKRIEIIRLPGGADMLEGLHRAVKENNIRNGVILVGIGSVTDYHYHVVASSSLPPKNKFSKASSPMDVVSVQGYIFDERVHAHISLSDENSVVGGHLEPGTKILTFLILTIGVLPDELNLKEYDRY
jgi:predicted DNA-binding protein with PD1-like motif